MYAIYSRFDWMIVSIVYVCMQIMMCRPDSFRFLVFVASGFVILVWLLGAVSVGLGYFT